MKTLITFIISLIFSFFINKTYANSFLKADFKMGNPEISSIHKMTFGPEGILFIGDSDAAQIIAIDLSEHPKLDNSKLKLDNIDKLVADMMGTTIDQVQITDMVVNPMNDNVYLSINHSSGIPILLRVEDNVLKQVPLDNVSYSKSSLVNPIGKDAKDRRGRSLRRWAIADIKYTDGKVLLSGLSNQEFASTFRSIDFPFNDTQESTSLEIYHAAHGKYETHAPIKTFIPTTVNGTLQIVASYTCTPLVVFPMNEIKHGNHHKGKTVAELGSGNSPVDMVEISNEGNRFLLIANTNRPLMKMDFKDLESFQGELTNPVVKKGAAEGVDYVNLPYVNVQQLDKIGNNGFIIIQRESNGSLVLKTGNSWWVQ
ncbi:hypothetical protein [Aquimarina litoralis]|uniref:hypothetical protein n=1 Tax=Aquimarina litoralis TaxID=584605 RepID=UPI001C5720A2|nr:hypothetical protein [Aquimarina litoralis]MBW1296493.1 hypothetical protein [Aquimarina litoralis]